MNKTILPGRCGAMRAMSSTGLLLLLVLTLSSCTRTLATPTPRPSSR